MSAAHIEALVVRERHAVPYAPVTIKTDAGPRRADRARRAPERIPGRRPAAGLDPRLPLRRDGRAGARLRRPGLRSRAQAARLPRRAGRARSSARKGSSTTTTATCAASPGVQRVEVNAEGLPGPERARRRPSRTAGHSLRLTLDLGLQKEGEKALLEGIEQARAGGKPARRRGVRGARPAQRPDPRDRLLPELRPQQVRQTADARPNTSS